MSDPRESFKYGYVTLNLIFSFIFCDNYRVSPKKLTFVWGAVAPTNFDLGSKVGGVLESSGSQLENAYNSFSVAFKTPEIFEFKVTYPKKSEFS